MITQERIQVLKELLASQLGGDSLAFKMLDVAICGHMTLEQQAKYLEDVANRGLVNA